jgi:hypothetical protein
LPNPCVVGVLPHRLPQVEAICGALEARRAGSTLWFEPPHLQKPDAAQTSNRHNRALKCHHDKGAQ